jgi:hypothetical protein
LSKLLSITDIEPHVEEVTGGDKTLDVVVDIFNRVNSGGTKLSKGDLALAKICAERPDARVAMKAKLKDWTEAGYHFNLDWLLRSVNTILHLGFTLSALRRAEQAAACESRAEKIGALL